MVVASKSCDYCGKDTYPGEPDIDEGPCCSGLTCERHNPGRGNTYGMCTDNRKRDLRLERVRVQEQNNTASSVGCGKSCDYCGKDTSPGQPDRDLGPCCSGLTCERHNPGPGDTYGQCTNNRKRDLRLERMHVQEQVNTAPILGCGKSGDFCGKDTYPGKPDIDDGPCCSGLTCERHNPGPGRTYGLCELHAKTSLLQPIFSVRKQ